MLRNPEIAIFVIYYLLGDVAIDLSSCANDLYKILAASLISSSDEIRERAVLCVAVIARKTTDAAALQRLVDGIFATYSGSDGKISSVGQRISVLEALKLASSHGSKDRKACETIAADVLQRLNPQLVSEVHQATSTALWDALMAWSVQLTDAHEKLLPIWKVALKSPARSAALKSIVTLFANEKKGRVLNADLSKLIMDIFKTRTNTSDFIVASLLLLDDEKTCGNVRQTLEKEDFCKEKFIVSLSTTGRSFQALILIF
ncbi:unnamed protein product [Gongylonema pulchrum]|uniref:Translational activator GCN1 n=1 Tax=Gongylonema pulchrum TaxID=637853 RepID=A0A183EDU8_9BILA|nr:unnamed protein product [Gongylonema pulchrum]